MNYFWAGVALTLVAIVWALKTPEPDAVTAAMIELLKTLGIAILIAAVFSFAASTAGFMDTISRRLRSIVVDRAFLSNIDDASKRETLYAILKPTDQQKTIYGNIEDYYRHYIDRTMQISNVCVRSNYVCECRVSLDPTNNVLMASYRIFYRLYPSTSGYDDIEIGFYGENNSAPANGGQPAKRVEYLSLAIYIPNGKSSIYNQQGLLQLPKIVKDKSEIVTIPVKDLGRDFDHLDIELKMIERGHDHWIMPGFQALQPTDGFRFHLECDAPLKIQEEQTFIHGAEWHKDPEEVEGESRMSIVCQQWIDQGSGVSAVVSMPHEHIRTLVKPLPPELPAPNTSGP